MMTERKLITEQQLVRIVEERGVAVSPWKKEIDTIAMYIRKKVLSEVKNGKIGNEINFEVPSKLCDVFPFLKCFKLNIRALPSSLNRYSGGGSFGGHIVYSQDKLYYGEMKIICFYNDEGKVWLNSILTSFYHEMNHAYDEWMNAHNDYSYERYNKSGLKADLGINLSKKYPTIGECIYRLFSETEYNALVASVFGDLQGRESKLSSFQNDYRATQAYWVYRIIKENIEKEINNLTLDEAKEILNELRNKEISLNLKKNTFKSFKIAFLTKTFKLLNELLHDIGRVASFYYDKKHQEEIENNGQPLPRI